MIASTSTSPASSRVLLATSRPAPPSVSSGFTPRASSSSRPTPPHVSVGPTPPAPTHYRPVPPSASGGPTPPAPTHDRPAPPSVSGGPTPPAPTQYRPAPPIVRPTNVSWDRPNVYYEPRTYEPQATGTLATVALWVGSVIALGLVALSIFSIL
jgi:hypothetical protein